MFAVKRGQALPVIAQRLSLAAWAKHANVMLLRVMLLYVVLLYVVLLYVVLLELLFAAPGKAADQSSKLIAKKPTDFELSEPDLNWVYWLNQQQKQHVQQYQAEAKAIIAGTVEPKSPSRGSCNKCSAKAQKVTPSLTEHYPSDRYPRLLIFVSFSMPMQVLKSLAQQAALLQGKLVFRGLVANSFVRTAQKLQELGSEALIDPTLFRAYAIRAVPVFVLQERSARFPGEAGIQHDRVAGNVSLACALAKMASQGEVARAATLLATLEARHG
ncbi:MAG: type-F conjugative transfer system pilin assembly protein TrbC [Pseudomonadota bacterium]